MERLSPKEMQAEALFLASKGYKVINAHLDRKAPVGKNWGARATTEPGAVKHFFGGRRFWNIAIVGGDGLVILDCDRKHGKDGVAMLEAMGVIYGPLPETVMEHTPSGGVHLFFKYDGNRLKNWVDVLPGVDIRGANACVIASPSYISGVGHYEWDAVRNPRTMDPAPLPGWLEELLVENGRKLEAHAASERATSESTTACDMDIGEAGPDIGEGTRNAALFQIASHLWGYGLVADKDMLLNRLKATNTNRCKPPLDDFEVSGIADNACDNTDYPRGWRHTEAWEDFADLEEKIPPGAKLIPPSYNEVGVAALMVQLFRGELAYCPSRGWMAWNGILWETDQNAGLRTAVKLVNALTAQAKQELATAKDEADRAQALAFQKFCRGLGSKTKLTGISELSKIGLTVPGTALDADPFLLNTPGGVYDLRTGEVAPPTPAGLCTKSTLAAPGPDGKTMWMDFLSVVTCGDQELEKYLQCCAGMALYGKVFHEGLVICYGTGRNGKSTLFNSLYRVLGGYGGEFPSEMLMADGGNRFAAASLEGRRFVIAKELDHNQRLDPGQLKKLCSTDPIRVERKFKDPELIEPQHTIFLYTNPLPKLDTIEDGTRRRIICIPFKAKIQNAKTDFADRLLDKAAPAMMQWLLDGARLFAANCFDLPAPPQAVVNATQGYIERESWLIRFLDECCIKAEGEKVRVGELYEVYGVWTGRNGERRLSQKEFANQLRDYGFETKPGGGHKTYFLGLGLQPEACAPET